MYEFYIGFYSIEKLCFLMRENCAQLNSNWLVYWVDHHLGATIGKGLTIALPSYHIPIISIVKVKPNL